MRKMITEKSISKFSEYTCCLSGLLGYIIAVFCFSSPEKQTGYCLMTLVSTGVFFMFVKINRENREKYAEKKLV